MDEAGRALHESYAASRNDLVVLKGIMSCSLLLLASLLLLLGDVDSSNHTTNPTIKHRTPCRSMQWVKAVNQ